MKPLFWLATRMFQPPGYQQILSIVTSRNFRVAIGCFGCFTTNHPPFLNPLTGFLKKTMAMARRTRRRKKTSVALKPNELRGLLSIVEGENASIVCKMLSIKVCFLEPETFTYWSLPSEWSEKYFFTSCLTWPKQLFDTCLCSKLWEHTFVLLYMHTAHHPCRTQNRRHRRLNPQMRDIRSLLRWHKSCPWTD